MYVKDKGLGARMGVATSSDGGSGLASPNILSKVSVKGGKADMDAFMTEGRMDNVQIAYVTKKQVGSCGASHSREK